MMPRTAVHLLIILLATTLLFVISCDGPTGPKGETGDPAPTSTDPPDCEPPTVLSVTISNGGCDATHCFASLGVSDTAVLKRAHWQIPGSDPDSCQGLTCNARWRLPDVFPTSFPWSVVACTSTEAEDPAGICCAPRNGNVRFDHALKEPRLVKR